MITSPPDPLSMKWRGGTETPTRMGARLDKRVR